MMPDSVPDMPLSLFPAIASKISTLSDADISLLADDAMACLIDAESSRFLKEEKDLLSRPSYSDEDERKLKEQKLLIGLNSHLQNPTTFLPNSQTGSHQNVVSTRVSFSIFSIHDPIVNTIHRKPFQFSTISVSLSQLLHNCI
jgi:hypothetical protein